MTESSLKAIRLQRRMGFDSSDTIVDQIKSAGAQYPDRIACIHNSSQKKYSSLLSEATVIAKHLGSANIQKGDLVFVRLHSSLNVPTVYLAIMLLGGVFVPVNPHWPLSRLESIVQAYKPQALISNDLPPINLPEVKIFTLSDLLISIKSNVVLPEISIEDKIYGFFTSGTTGTPKCAINIHRGIRNRFDYMSKTFKALCDNGNVVLQNSNLSFDSSIWQILWPLTQGGTVVVRDGSAITDFDKILDTISQTGVKMTDFVPTIFHRFTRYIEGNQFRIEKLKSLEALLIGGEAIEPEIVWSFKNMVPQVKIFNTYGPTECSIGMMFHHVTEKDRDYIPIGTPIDNTFALVVNENGKRAAYEESGEIVIGGECLGLGYLNDKAKTDNVFLINSFDGYPGERVYLTGDIGYQSEDGLFHFLGRRDAQIKIGGARLELSEIESELSRIKSVRRAKAISYEFSGLVKIACFIISSESLSVEEVQQHLGETIPKEFMPSQIQFLASYPQNDNGKVDVKALRKLIVFPEKTDVNAESKESRTLSLIKQATGIEVSGLSDNLFECGATSMDVYLVCDHVKRYFGVNLEASALLGEFTASKIVNLLNEESTLSGTSLRNLNVTEKLIEKDKNWVANSVVSPRDPHSQGRSKVLITGGTGYVGSHVLSWLLQHTKSEIICLVRHKKNLNPRSFRDIFASYGQSVDEQLLSRIVPIYGDLGEPMFGLSTSSWEALGNEVSSVYALGARVNLRASYDQLRHTNVLSLQEIIRFSATYNAHIRYLSSNTINGFLSLHSHNWNSQDVLNASLTGYDQTKLMCEAMLDKFSEKGGKVTLVRVGDVVPVNGSSLQNVNSMLTYMTHLCREVGAIPDLNTVLDVAPINLVVERIVSNDTGVRICSEPLPLSDFLSQQLMPLTPDNKRISQEEFYRRLKTLPVLTKEAQLMSTSFLKPGFESLEQAVSKELSTSSVC